MATGAQFLFEELKELKVELGRVSALAERTRQLENAWD